MPRDSLPQARWSPLGAASLAIVFLLVSSPAPAPAQQAAAPSAAAPQTEAPEALTIEHEAPGCVLAGKYALLSACFSPAAALSRARVYFRAGGSQDWFYVEMSGKAPCLQGVLPRPKKELARIDYYISATTRKYTESRTREHSVAVSADGTCNAGALAPVTAASGVVIGSVSGAVPAGFLTGGGLSPLLLVGGAAVIGGGAAAVAVGGGGGEGGGSTSTTLPPTTSTSTSTTTATTTTTTTTTTPTTQPPCESPNAPPSVDSLSPSSPPAIGGFSGTVSATASDAGSGVRLVRFYYQRCGGAACSWSPGAATEMSGSPVTAPPYSFTWNFPSCGPPPDSYFNIAARAEDNCGNLSSYRVNSVVLNGRGCFRGDASSAAVTAWVSVLSVPDGRGQVVVDGKDAVFPAGGSETFAARVGPGLHRLEAVLVEGAGRPGTWRFDLSGLDVVPGSVRVVAGEAAQAGPAELTFRLRGRAGERVVFSFNVAGDR